MTDDNIKKLRKLIEELQGFRGRHTELVSVYIPAGYRLAEVINQLKQEQGTAENIKSKSTRKNVVDALEKAVQYMKNFKDTPKSGLIVFSGNISEHEGVSDVKVWGIEPPEPLNVKMYWCGQAFRLEPLLDMVKEKEVFGLVVMDVGEATVGILRGKTIQVTRHMDSIVPGKTSKGGQCLGHDTVVFASDGSFPRIADVRNGLAVKSALFDSFSVCDSSVLDAWSTEKGECFKIITKYPRLELESSKDHMFFVWEDGELKEKAAEELKEGDTLLMPEKITVKGMRHKLKTDYFFSFTISKEGRRAIKNARAKREISQKQLAAEVGLTQTALSCIELGKRDFKVQNLEKICQALGMDLGYFFKKYAKPKGCAILPGTLDENVAQILGYFIGDGNYDKNRIAFSERDMELAKHYADKLKDVFGVTPAIKFRKSKNYNEIRVCSKVVEGFMRGEFLGSKDALHAGIPEKILTSEDPVIASFLRGLFDAEGYISGGRFGFGVYSKVLATHVQMALLRFGIISSLLEYDCKRNPYSKNHRFTVEISEKESLERFNKMIGFSSAIKREKLALVIRRKTEKSNVRQVLVSGKLIREIIERHGMKKQNFGKVSDYFYDKKEMSKKTFEKSILRYAEENKGLHQELRSILQRNVLPVKIRSISRSVQSTPMIDISVGRGNFIANGLIVHNSAQRYERVREGLINDFYKKVAEAIKAMNSDEVKGIIMGGPGPGKEDFLRGEYLPTNIKNKILGIRPTGYADETGLHELLERGKDLIAEAAFTKEKELLKKFFEQLQKDTGMVTYGMAAVLKALEAGAVATLLISEGLDWIDGEFLCGCGFSYRKFVRRPNVSSEKCPKCKGPASLIGEMGIDQAMEEMAKKYGTKIEFISRETSEGEQLAALGGIAAFLRYKFGE